MDKLDFTYSGVLTLQVTKPAVNTPVVVPDTEIRKVVFPKEERKPKPNGHFLCGNELCMEDR